MQKVSYPELKVTDAIKGAIRAFLLSDSDYQSAQILLGFGYYVQRICELTFDLRAPRYACPTERQSVKRHLQHNMHIAAQEDWKKALHGTQTANDNSD